MKIVLNFALSADGKIAPANQGPSHFTSRRDLERLHEIRTQADAILVGRKTLEADNMSLTVAGRQPWRCVISRTGHLSPQHPLFQTDGGPRHLIITESQDSPDLPATLHHCSLEEWLSSLELNVLLCEGGGTLAKALFALDRVNEIFLTWAPHTLLGGRDAPTLTGPPAEFLPASRTYKLRSCSPAAAGEWFLEYQRAES